MGLGLFFGLGVGGSGGFGLVAEFAGGFGEELVHGDGRTAAAQQVFEEAVNFAAFAADVVGLEVEEGVGVPFGEAAVEHGLALLGGGDVHVLDVAAGMLGDFFGEFGIGERFGAVEFVSLAGVLAAGERFGGDDGDVADVEEADAGVAHGGVKNSLRADGGREVFQNILMVAVGAKNGEGDLGGLELVFDAAVPTGEGLAPFASAQGGVQDDVADTGGDTGVNHVPFEFDELRDGRADQVDGGNAFERRRKRVLPGEVGANDLGSGGSFHCFCDGVIHGAVFNAAFGDFG